MRVVQEMNRAILARICVLCVVIGLLVGLARGHVESNLLIREADWYRSRKEFSRAISVYEQLAVLRPESALPRLRLGQVFLFQGRLDEAEREFSDALRLSGAQDEVLLGLGQIAYQQGDVGDALNYWRGAAALNLRNADAHYWLGRAYLARSLFELAKGELERAVQRDHDHQRAHYYLGLLYAAENVALSSQHLRLVGSGDDSQLSNAAQQMLYLLEETTLSEDEPYVAARLAHAYVKYEVPSLAVAQLKKVLAFQPENHAARAYLGYALFAQGENGEARMILREVTRVAPEYPLGYYFLAFIHRSEGYLPTALWEFKRSLLLDPSNAAVYADIADTYQRMGQHLAAADWYRAAVEVAPHEADFHILLAQFYVDVLLRADEGLAAARQAVALASDDPLAQDLLGWAHYLAGDLAEARSALEEALRLDPDYARSYYHLGVVYSQLRDEDKAQWAFERAIDLDRDGAYRERAMAELASGDWQGI